MHNLTKFLSLQCKSTGILTKFSIQSSNHYEQTCQFSIGAPLLKNDRKKPNEFPKKNNKRKIPSKKIQVFQYTKKLKDSASKPAQASKQQQRQQREPDASPFGLATLSEADCKRRVKFASTLLELLHKDPKLIHNIVFSDEGNFWPFVSKNRSSELVSRPPFTSAKKSRKLYAESKPLPTIVWAGMTTKEIIGPYFFNAHVTASSYLSMLRKYFLPQLLRSNYNLSTTWFQQDGAPPHRSPQVLSFLSDTFGPRLLALGINENDRNDVRTDQQQQPLEWPSRSQDLSPLDYFFWDYMKTKMKSYTPKTTENLRECLAFEMESIDTEVLERFVQHEFYKRLELCVKVDGRRFQIEPVAINC